MLPLSQSMAKRDASQCRSSRVKGLELHHRVGQPFHKPVLLLDDDVQIFALVNRDFEGFILAFCIERDERTCQCALSGCPCRLLFLVQSLQFWSISNHPAVNGRDLTQCPPTKVYVSFSTDDDYALVVG